ncbi:conserved hypothetical protein [Sporisorium reilianum SRZ2]|uniref:Transmembrane protein 19 n=1 Tax=Sporisorium reilianum (strain SRZ2) TaxID=999809 RepID=E6ZVT1_SPORE|nr:conserved hypothetical protein [Sporisorium reilianum SRZ2]
MSTLHPLPLGIAAYLGYSGYRKGSLSLSGALTASAVGYASMANPYVGYGLTLITFYLAGSRATKFKADRKAELETHSPTATSNPLGAKKRDTSSGNRTATQVLCNSLTAVVACVAFRVLNRTAHTVDPLSTAILATVGAAGVQCRVTSLGLTLVVAGHYAACMGDTLASELGILSHSPPRLVTNPLRTVPRGTNGAVSALGLLVSAAGGSLVALTQSAALVLHYGSPTAVAWSVHAKLMALLTAAGLVGSLLDSVLGATLQQTLYNPKSGKVLVGPLTDAKKADWTRVTGWDVLSNNSVNFVASATTALLTAWLGSRVF